MKSPTLLRLLAFGVLGVLTFQPSQAAQSSPAGQPARIFRLYADDFWLSLHHFLYVLGRADAKMPDMTRRAVVGAPAEQNAALGQLSADDQRTWRDAVRFYANGPSRQDAVFDEPLVKAGGALADAGDSPSLATVDLDSSLREVLERAAPIYRKTWWPAHRTANQKWITSAQPLIERHGTSVLTFITRAYGLDWPPDGYPVHLSGYANWAGAFSTSGNLLVISSLDAGNSGVTALETIFHEAMHHWDDPITARLRNIAKSEGTAVPPNLTHALIWMTAGEAVRRVVPGHVPYAEENGLWRGRLGTFKPALEAVWLPFLDGQGTRDAAFQEVLRRLQPVK